MMSPMILFGPKRMMDKPHFLRVSMVLTMAEIKRMYRQIKAMSDHPGFISYRGNIPRNSVNMIAWLHDPEWTWLKTRLRGYVSEINEMHWGLDIGGHLECQFTRYRQGQDYGWHCDVDASCPTRTLSMTIELKSASGGGIEFHNGGPVPLLPDEGVLFPSTETHRATMVTEGVRDSLICWFNSR